MTNSEIKKAVEIMLAYANGKEIECKESDSDSGWRCCNDPCFDWFHYDYRIKPEPKYRPFKNKDECWQEMLKHQPFGWIIDSEENLIIISVSNAHIWFSDRIYYTFEDAFDNFKFADGTPFGIKEN